MTVVVPHITHGGGGGWNDGTMFPDFQAGARPGSQPPTPGTESQSVMSGTVRVIRANSEWFNYRPVG
jgi:hypothetical protein